MVCSLKIKSLFPIKIVHGKDFEKKLALKQIIISLALLRPG